MERNCSAAGAGDIEFDSTGQRIVSVTRSGAVQVWDSELRPLRTLVSSGPHLRCVAWSADGTRIATGGADAVVRLYDMSTGRQVTSLHGHVAAVTSLRFVQNDAFLTSTALDGTVRVWDRGD